MTQPGARRVRVVLLTVLTAGGLACIFPTDTCACVRVDPPGVVLGTVTHASGAAAVGARVNATVSFAPCGTTAPEPNQLLGVTDAAGKFVLEVGVAGVRRCVSILATLQNSQGTAETVVDPVIGGRPDTVTVTVRLTQTAASVAPQQLGSEQLF